MVQLSGARKLSDVCGAQNMTLDRVEHSNELTQVTSPYT
jgi:hypothetical protein